MKDTPIVIENKIYIIRGYKVMMDKDLAELYEITTGNLNLAVKRNKDRFPSEFAFQLSQEEYNSLILQFARSNAGRGGQRHLPYVFTEHGVAMLSSILKSKRAIQMNISIVKAFIKMRELLYANKDLALRLEKLERSQEKQGDQIVVMYSILKKLTDEPINPKGKIGFRTD